MNKNEWGGLKDSRKDKVNFNPHDPLNQIIRDNQIGIIYGGQSMMQMAHDFREMHDMCESEEDKRQIRKMYRAWHAGYYFTHKSRGKK